MPQPNPQPPFPDEPLGEVQLLLEDGPLLALYKPGGLLTQAPPGIDCSQACGTKGLTCNAEMFSYINQKRFAILLSLFPLAVLF